MQYIAHAIPRSHCRPEGYSRSPPTRNPGAHAVNNDAELAANEIRAACEKLRGSDDPGILAGTKLYLIALVMANDNPSDIWRMLMTIAEIAERDSWTIEKRRRRSKWN